MLPRLKYDRIIKQTQEKKMNALTYPFKEGDCVNCTDLTDEQVQLILDRMLELGANQHEAIGGRYNEYQLLTWRHYGSSTFFKDTLNGNNRLITWEQIMEYEEGNMESDNGAELNKVNHEDQQSSIDNLSVGKLIDKLFTALADSSIMVSVSGNGKTTLSSNCIEEINASEMSAEEIDELCDAMMVIERCMLVMVKGE